MPQGRVEHYTWSRSEVYPGTTRDYWVYVPAQYNPEEPACVMVFQDGMNFARTNGNYRVPIVFDNLIHKKEMPVTIAVFVDHGKVTPLRTNALPRFNRSFEYDALGDRYATFLMNEILPEVQRKYRITTNAAGRAIGGESSGAIAAFTAAWERPDYFSKVFSSIGTYVGLRGGDEYPTLVRKTEPRPIRVFLQDGSSDLNIYGGDWFMANQDMLSALTWAGYDVKHAWGEGGHNGRHAGSIFPDAMRWLWRDYPNAIAKPGEGKRTPWNEILGPGQEWELVSSGHTYAESPAVNSKGEIFFSDIKKDEIYRIDNAGKVTIFAQKTGGANGLVFNREGDLFACATKLREISRYTPDGERSTYLRDISGNEITINEHGDIWFTDIVVRSIWYAPNGYKGREPIRVETNIERPTGIILTPDHSMLMVCDSASPMVYSYQLLPYGTLTNKQPFFQLHSPPMLGKSLADGVAVDRDGRLYVATAMGIQVCDQAGRVNAILAKPQRGPVTNIEFGGPDMDYLYATAGDKVFRRKMKVKGLAPWADPVTPAPPRL